MASISPECRAFLLAQARTAQLATVRADGRPHVVPVWFVLDGDTIVFTAGHKTVKALNMQRDPRVCLCVDDETPPFTFAQIEGTATLSDLPPADLLPWTTRIAGRYMGAALAESYGQRNAVVANAWCASRRPRSCSSGILPTERANKFAPKGVPPRSLPSQARSGGV